MNNCQTDSVTLKIMEFCRCLLFSYIRISVSIYCISSAPNLIFIVLPWNFLVTSHPCLLLCVCVCMFMCRLYPISKRRKVPMCMCVCGKLSEGSRDFTHTNTHISTYIYLSVIVSPCFSYIITIDISFIVYLFSLVFNYVLLISL
uniref:SJCHGC06504 protein n=1 Tax=Schistosoma japonicum TaxID=6182 RepID=Q5DEQ4_SCHJA|nr:SJCHGC06504 protein [Schistosoma japonicum]